MIYTVTLNPALDYVVDLPEFQTGKVNRAVSEHIFYGGKGINVSGVLKELGFESQCLGFIAGFTGEQLKKGVKELGLVPQFVEVDKGMTRINFKIHSDLETELNGPGPKIEQKDIALFLEKIDNLVSGDLLILSGSIPSSLSSLFYNEILERVKDKDIHVVVDTTGQALIESLKYHPFLIKPNNHELAEMFGVKLQSIDDIETYARKLQGMGARNVLISMAKDGSLLIDENGKSHLFGVFKGTVKNSVGAGDSMVAGFVAGYLMNKDYDDILKLATAAGGATAFSEGLATKEKIEELLKQK